MINYTFYFLSPVSLHSRDSDCVLITNTSQFQSINGKRFLHRYGTFKVLRAEGLEANVTILVLFRATNCFALAFTFSVFKFVVLPQRTFTTVT
ncbi:hypothetical protein Bpfe_025325, partial [Biomphalaria pfeifferi]